MNYMKILIYNKKFMNLLYGIETRYENAVWIPLVQDRVHYLLA
jgi:hypothetical protein